MPIHVVDFFSGCGGTSTGLLSAGMTIRLGLDIDSDSAETFRHNFPNSAFICKDIRNVSLDEVAGHLPLDDSPILFTACAPCQPFSKQNRFKNNEDKRQTLLNEFHRFLIHFRPHYVFLENVPGLQKVLNQEGPFTEFLSLLTDLGYSYEYEIVMAQKYGVPQFRRRLILLASRLGPISIPSPTHGPGTSQLAYRTVWDHIGQLPPIEAGEEHPVVPNHRAARLSAINLRRIASTPEGGGRHNWPAEIMLECHRAHVGHTDVYGRLWKDRPASAMTTRCISLSNGRFGHPTQNRAISVREAACLQTFPDDFHFVGSLQSMARQVGNAVPVQLAKIFGEAVISHWNETITTGR